MLTPITNVIRETDKSGHNKLGALIGQQATEATKGLVHWNRASLAVSNQDTICRLQNGQ